MRDVLIQGRRNEELVAKIVGDESGNDFIDEDELKSDEDLRIVYPVIEVMLIHLHL